MGDRNSAFDRLDRDGMEGLWAGLAVAAIAASELLRTLGRGAFAAQIRWVVAALVAVGLGSILLVPARLMDLLLLMLSPGGH